MQIKTFAPRDHVLLKAMQIKTFAPRDHVLFKARHPMLEALWPVVLFKARHPLLGSMTLCRQRGRICGVVQKTMGNGQHGF